MQQRGAGQLGRITALPVASTRRRYATSVRLPSAAVAVTRRRAVSTAVAVAAIRRTPTGPSTRSSGTRSRAGSAW